MNEQGIFYSWEQACDYVGDGRFLNELSELYFHFAGFASVEVERGTFDRVYVDGYLKLYPADVNELKQKLPVTYSSAIIDHNITINGAVRDDLFQKFLVFDDELIIGSGKGEQDNEFNYPGDIHFNQIDLNRVCDAYGIQRPETEPHSKPVIVEDEVMLKVIGALACMLAMDNDLEASLQNEQHISEIIIDDLFAMLDGMGVDIDGKQKFLYERIISDGVKTILES
ncbi:MAG: hypothetical protein G8D61_04445 [gamma proteobacterium symbiont of Ctena orbiculata]|nr:hypothetical protein [Candidatus Thiodiazotropha taylori]MBT3058076.1 hypothetical protein [Candidatus Thiodiazotropha sp. (ex Lucina pensylvanica)]MBV2097307.1 hypothetical protein [Candidatus Thiodiazotropha sp. (ex Codakia orbicularis)]PUB77218.1 MAG: hypothetical protein DBO99_10760 [gamma proteobacterium symbiont of Ctena orbiculata]MBT3062732.1 hypothetical protein [Candidatus Thiodiazotropha sp. (ex Lucina pensylvanica)]